MSFVFGFVTGMTTGEAVQRRKGSGQLRDYLQQHEYSIVDRHGRVMAVDAVAEDAFGSMANSNRKILIVGAVVLVAAVFVGGSALILLAAA
jgi:hypothetical protein